MCICVGLQVQNIQKQKMIILIRTHLEEFLLHRQSRLRLFATLPLVYWVTGRVLDQVSHGAEPSLRKQGPVHEARGTRDNVPVRDQKTGAPARCAELVIKYGDDVGLIFVDDLELKLFFIRNIRILFTQEFRTVDAHWGLGLWRRAAYPGEGRCQPLGWPRRRGQARERHACPELFCR